MTLTVPRAGVTAGRAPGVQIEADETGAAVAQFGARIGQAGMSILNDALDRQATRLQIDMTKALGEARLEFEQMNDPDAIDAGWQQRATELRQRFVTGDERNPMHPRLRERVGLAFDELANRHAMALGARAIEARRNQRAAYWTEYSTEVLTQSRTADPDTRAVLLDQAIRKVDEDLAANLITPFEAAQRKITLREDAANAAAIGLVDSDPASFLDRVDAGEFNDLAPEKIETYRVRAQANIDQAAAATEREAEAAAKERETAIGNRLDTITNIAGKGLVNAEEVDFLSSPEARAHPKFAEAMAAVQLRDEIPGLSTLTPAELEAQLAAERAKPLTAEYQAERVAVLERLVNETRQGWAADGVAYARDKGFRVPELPPFDPANPAAFEAGLSERLTFAARATAEGYTESPPIFDDAELTQLKSVAAVSADPAVRAELARSIWRATGGRPDPVARLLEGDAVFSYATGLIGATGSTTLARELFAGQQKIEGKTVNLPAQRDQVIVFDELTAGMFEGQPQVKAQIMAATAALYANGATGINPDETSGGAWRDGEARATYEQAMQRVLGAAPDASGNLTIGGVQEIDTGWTLLPPGVSRDRANDALRKIEMQLRGAAWDPNLRTYVFNELREGVDPMRGLRAASLTGRAPDLGEEARERWGEVRMVAIGDDRYKLVWDGGDGRVLDVPDETGARYEFSLRKLIGAEQ
jgi:hypothetical protein